MKRFLVLVFASVFLAANVGFSRLDDEPEAVSTKKIMGIVFKGKTALKNKLIDGSASDEEKETAIKLMTALSKNKPAKGDAESWKEKTSALLKAAKAIKEGEDGAGEAFKKAADCGACHKAHKE